MYLLLTLVIEPTEPIFHNCATVRITRTAQVNSKSWYDMQLISTMLVIMVYLILIIIGEESMVQYKLAYLLVSCLVKNVIYFYNFIN